ncbi:MAG: hypothetical protein IKP47_06470 [Ruminococcus sp.]|nr:hypothetical protein [Ruminococcus sp.]
MLVLLDDIKIRDRDTFMSYISNTFKGNEITTFDDLRAVLRSMTEEVEFIISDYDTIEDKSFAEIVVAELNGMSAVRENIKVTMM